MTVGKLPGFINTFLYNNKDFTCKSDPLRLASCFLAFPSINKPAISKKETAGFFIYGRAIRCKSSARFIALHLSVGFSLLSLTRGEGRTTPILYIRSTFFSNPGKGQRIPLYI
jgi:hypothetical protein